MSKTSVLNDPRFLAATAVAVTLLGYSVLLSDDRETVRFFAGTEMLYEFFGALFFLMSSVLYLALFARLRRRDDRRKLPCLLLGVFFFVACGEELSWGQHALGFGTPDSLQELNRQQEVNLHNLGFLDSYDDSGQKKTGLAGLLNSNRLFDYFMLGFFVAVPFAAAWLPWARRWIERLGVPVAAVAFAAPLVLNMGLTVAFHVWRVDSMFWRRAVSETRELSYAFLCLAGAWYLWSRVGKTPAAEDSVSP